jgi:NADPH-dependent 2,4-dienoyl-CoA reductase/sulfur reductase-like enzyme
VQSVVTGSGAYDCDMVIVAIGVVPNSELAARARIHLGPHGGILTDERQMTSVDSIFGAGDCCEIKNLVTGRWSYVPLATYASRQGRVAGENAAGGRSVFKGGIHSIAVKIFELEVARVGISLNEAMEAGFEPLKVHITSDTKVGFFPGNEKTNISVIIDKKTKRLLGANVYGGKGSVLRANIMAIAIQQKMTITELAQMDLIYSPPFSPLWDPILVLANHARQMLKS